MEELDPSSAHAANAVDQNHVERWLGRFEQALNTCDRDALKALFADDCHWRDLVAFTWTIAPLAERDPIVDRLIKTQPQVQARNFRLAKGHAAPRWLKRIGIDVIEAIFEFETKAGRGYGVVRLLDAEPEKAWVLMTSLHELKGREEPINGRRPSGEAYSREFGGLNWAERRAKEQAFADREPAVLIIGAGQAGLTTAARLRLMGVEALCVEKLPRVGDNWRIRYQSLALHNKVPLNHMAYMPFPPSWPSYLPKDMIGNWLEQYALSMECNVWTSTTFLGGDFDEAGGHWNARVRLADGSERVLRPRHILFANGIVGAPHIPKLPGLEDFKGVVQHTHGFKDGSAWRGKNALVLGAGTSGHDIAQDLYSHGASTKLIQRGAITITSVGAANLSHALYYDEGLSVEDCDLIATAATFPLFKRAALLLTKRQQAIDKDLLERLTKVGFKVDLDEYGYVMKVRNAHAGYYLNCGCSELVADGKIGVIQSDDIERFVADGALMKDGRVEKADLLVTATGYQNQIEVVRELLGSQIADKVGKIWGLDADNELANMYKPTKQKGLWFLGSSLAQARIYSKFIALQIAAREAKLIPY
jgi:cation diffusion facilitator CzcD-associated flavoprotein CzcO